jgi:hypothetical protein
MLDDDGAVPATGYQVERLRVENVEFIRCSVKLP